MRSFCLRSVLEMIRVLLLLVRFSPACILAFLATAVSRGEFIDAWSWVDKPGQMRSGVGQKDAGTLTSPGERKEPVLQNGSARGHETEGGEEAVEQLDGDADCRPKRKTSKKRG